MWINKKGEKLTITFNYDPKIVAAIRDISGRKFNDKYKRWEVPLYSAKEAVNALKPFGFNLHIDVVQIVKKEEEMMEKIEIIRKDPGVYSGVLPLYGFQKIGASFMKAMDHSLLGDVPGLGKTIQTIGALDNEGPHLIIVPASLKYSWEEEIEKWSPETRVQVVDGDAGTRMKQWKGWTNLPTYFIANYELLLRDIDLIKEIPWKTIVADEATRISNPRAKTTKALKSIKCEKRIALTGTPVSNSPVDVYSIVDWLYPGYLGDFYSFQKKYCVMDEFEGWEVRPTWNRVVGFQNLDELSEKVGKIMLRRHKADVLTDFPEKTSEKITFELSQEEREVYTSLKNQIFEELQKLKIEGHNLHVIPVKMLRLKQITNDVRLVSHETNVKSSKLQLLKDLLVPVVRSGDKMIVFTQFAEMAKILAEELQEYNPLLIYGDVSSPARFEAVTKFNDPEEEHKVMIMTEAGAYGLNLQAASYVTHYDSPWSIAKLTQREDRSHRIGQTKPVTVYHLIAKNSIDEYVSKVLHKKQEISDEILQDETKYKLDLHDVEEILKP